MQGSFNYGGDGGIPAASPRGGGSRWTVCAAYSTGRLNSSLTNSSPDVLAYADALTGSHPTVLIQ